MYTAHAPKTGAEIAYDGKSFIIDGRRVFLNSAAIHYFRMPKEEWREVLVKAKLAGMNCIDTYFAWNVHEPNEGEWNFEGDADCGAFLDLCAELGLWAIARPGPYICAEWDFGGFPWWLGRKEGVKFRACNETYLKYVDLYFDRITAIIRQRQLSQGGTVILVQVENEYGYLTDDASASAYMSHLRDGLLGRGIDVPLITCVGGVEGAIEGANFWSGADQHYETLAKKQPDMPKIVTEFWSGWFEHWGAPAATQKTARLYEKRMYEAVQSGFTGISHYMFFGGTNFAGYGGRTVGSSDIFMVTSYDYDAPLNEYGRTTPKYMAAKRFSLFMHAVGPLLLESESWDTSGIAASSGVTVRGRRNGEQRLLFVASAKEEREAFHLTLEDGRTLPVMVNPGEIVPVLDGFRMLDGVRLTCNAPIACNESVDGIHTLIVYAKDGQRSFVELNADEEIQYEEDQPLLDKRSVDRCTISFDLYHFNEPHVIPLTIGGKALRVIALNTTEMDRTWRIAEGQWVGGCFDVDIESDGQLTAAFSDSARSAGLSSGFRPVPQVSANAETDAEQSVGDSESQKPPVLNGWASSALDLASLQGAACPVPQDFSSFSQPFGYLAYSSMIESEDDRQTTLILPKLQDTARVYMNGMEIGLIREVGSSSIVIPLRKGANQLQILVQSMGRLNFSPYLGEPKGLFDTGYLQGTALDLRAGWMHGEETVNLDRVNKLDGQPNLLRTFHLQGHDRAVLVGAVSAPLRVNGKEVPMEGYHNWFAHQTVDISAYIQPGDNVVEMPYFKSPINRLELLSYHSSDGIGEWSMAGMADGAPSEADSMPMPATGGTRAPAWHRCEFAKPAHPGSVRAKLKLRLTGMSKGSIWLNGINLGRYWQIGPQEDYKVPMAWLQDTNELILFDEEGRSPAKVKLLFDDQSDRSWVKIEG